MTCRDSHAYFAFSNIERWFSELCGWCRTIRDTNAASILICKFELNSENLPDSLLWVMRIFLESSLEWFAQCSKPPQLQFQISHIVLISTFRMVVVSSWWWASQHLAMLLIHFPSITPVSHSSQFYEKHIDDEHISILTKLTRNSKHIWSDCN